MPKIELGTLDSVPIRKVFEHEAQDFTPWLARNLDQLGSALHLDLQLVESEGAIGPFSADVIADADSGLVIIENQLEQTDHSHLGQLLTYAAGRDARVLIWITPEFRDEHRAAVDWLNRWTSDEIEVYGVEVRAVRIGDSVAAPDFRAVAFPNNWSRRAKSGAVETSMSNDVRSRRIEFFASLARRAHERGLTQSLGLSAVTKSKSFPCQVGERGLVYWVDLPMNGGITVQLVIGTPNPDRNMSIIEGLMDDREATNGELGFEPEWTAPDPLGPHGRKAGRILVRRNVTIDASPERTDELLSWALNALERYQQVLEPRLRDVIENLQAEEVEAVGD